MFKNAVQKKKKKKKKKEKYGQKLKIMANKPRNYII